MKVIDILDHIKEIGTFVDWEDTTDKLLYGDENNTIRKIGVNWICDDESIKISAKAGCNLIFTHEPLFYYGLGSDNEILKQSIKKKKKLLDKYDISIIRIHDTWDRLPKLGIVDAWADFLGYESFERETTSYYKLLKTDKSYKTKEIAQQILDKVSILGENYVIVQGNKDKVINKIAIGTGAITKYPKMLMMKPDLIIASDDGTNFWEHGMLALDNDVPVIIVGHCTCELPGIFKMTEYFNDYCKNVDVIYVGTPFPMYIL